MLSFSIALKVNASNNQNIIKDINTRCAHHICPPQLTSVVVNDVCICSRYNVLPIVEKRQDVEQDEAHICAAHVCPPRFGGVIVDDVCQCIQLVGLRPTPSLVSTVSTISTIQPTKTPTVKRAKLQGITTDTSVATRQEIVEDEAIICAVHVCPPRFGAIIIDKVCTCTRFGLPPPTPVKRSEIAYEDCETPCESGYTGKLFGEYCRCMPPSNDHPFTNAITKRQEVTTISLLPAPFATSPLQMEEVDVVAFRV